MGRQPVTHSAASGPPFHGLRTSGAIAAMPSARPNTPAAAPAARLITVRRAMPVSLPALTICATTVRRATSSDAPSWRCCTDTSSGKNLFTYAMTPMPSASTARPNVPPTIGV